MSLHLLLLAPLAPPLPLRRLVSDEHLALRSPYRARARRRASARAGRMGVQLAAPPSFRAEREPDAARSGAGKGEDGAGALNIVIVPKDETKEGCGNGACCAGAMACCLVCCPDAAESILTDMIVDRLCGLCCGLCCGQLPSLLVNLRDRGLRFF